MCGIIYGRRKDKQPINNSILKRYRQQKHRGSQGFGFLPIVDGHVGELQRFRYEFEVTEALKACTADEVIFHHRLPTSTPNYAETTHPIKVKHKMLDHVYYIIHNGVIKNHSKLKVKHDALGFEYGTTLEEITTIRTSDGNEYSKSSFNYNDSEALAIDLALYLDGYKGEIEAVGTIAFIALKCNKKGKVLNIYYGRNSGNPLVLENNNDLFFLKSEGNKHDLEIKTDVLVSIDYETGDYTQENVKIGSLTEYTPPPLGFGTPSQYHNVHGDDDFVEHPVGGRSQGRLPILPEYTKKFDPSEEDFIDARFIVDKDGHIREEYLNDEYEAYAYSEEYLLSLWEEIEQLHSDIREASDRMFDAIDQNMDITGAEDYLQECEDTLAEKMDESREICLRLYGEDKTPAYTITF